MSSKRLTRRSSEQPRVSRRLLLWLPPPSARGASLPLQPASPCHPAAVAPRAAVAHLLVVRHHSCHSVRWALIILNLIAAIALLFLGGFAATAHRTHAFSVYRELQLQHVLVERPDYDVQHRLETIAADGSYSLWLAYIGAAACTANALLIASCFKTRKP
jgi:hypothetical protein